MLLGNDGKLKQFIRLYDNTKKGDQREFIANGWRAWNEKNKKATLQRCSQISWSVPWAEAKRKTNKVDMDEEREKRDSISSLPFSISLWFLLWSLLGVKGRRPIIKNYPPLHHNVISFLGTTPTMRWNIFLAGVRSLSLSLSRHLLVLKCWSSSSLSVQWDCRRSVSLCKRQQANKKIT